MVETPISAWSSDVVAKQVSLTTSSSVVVPATPSGNPIITPTDRDILFANENGVWVCAMGANHFANQLLQDLILLHRVIGLIQNKGNVSVDDLVRRLFLLMKNGKRYELAGLKGVSKSLFTGTGRFLRLRKKEQNTKEAVHEQQQEKQEENEKKRKIAIKKEEGDSQQESIELQGEQEVKSKEPERKRAKVEEVESDRNIKEVNVEQKSKEEKVKADLHRSSDDQPWEVLTDDQAQDFLRSLITREFEKAVSVDEISVKEAFAKFLNDNRAFQAPTNQKEETAEKASNLISTALTSDDIGVEKSGEDCKEKTQTNANNNKNQHDEDNENKKGNEDKLTIADEVKTTSTDKDEDNSNDKSRDQSQNNCNTMDVDEENNSGGTEGKKKEDEQATTNEATEENTKDEEKGKENEEENGKSTDGEKNDIAKTVGNKKGIDTPLNAEEGKVKKENIVDSDNTQRNRENGNNVESGNKKDEGCTSKTEVYYNQLILATSQDILLLPCGENFNARLGELQSCNKFFLNLASHYVPNEISNSPMKRVEAAISVVLTRGDIKFGTVKENSECRFLIRTIVPNTNEIKYTIMNPIDAVEFTLIFLFEVFLEKQALNIAAALATTKNVQLQQLQSSVGLMQAHSNAPTPIDNAVSNEKVVLQDFSKPGTIPIDKPTTHDVLFGRGGMTNSHHGNRRFRDIIALHRPDYVRAVKNDKPNVARKIVRAIRSANPPGRFLKKGDDGRWYDVGDRCAAEKTSQGLRERSNAEKRQRSALREALRIRKEDLAEASKQGTTHFLGAPSAPTTASAAPSSAVVAAAAHANAVNAAAAAAMGHAAAAAAVHAQHQAAAAAAQAAAHASTSAALPGLGSSPYVTNPHALNNYVGAAVTAATFAASLSNVPLSLNIKDNNNKTESNEKKRIESSKTSDSILPEEESKREGAPPNAVDKDGNIIVTDYDILCGRGGLTNHHKGNKRFRDIVALHRPDYVRAPKVQKPSVARVIVRAIRNGDPRGRFLKKDEKTGLWVDIGDKRAAEKTSQALREKSNEDRDRIKAHNTVAQHIPTPIYPGTAGSFVSPTAYLPAVSLQASMAAAVAASSSAANPIPSLPVSAAAYAGAGGKNEYGIAEADESSPSQQNNDSSHIESSKIKEQAQKITTV